MPVSAEGRVENQNEPKRPPPCGRLGSFWFSTRFTRKKVIRLARKTVYIGVVSHGARPQNSPKKLLIMDLFSVLTGRTGSCRYGSHV